MTVEAASNRDSRLYTLSTTPSAAATLPPIIRSTALELPGAFLSSSHAERLLMDSPTVRPIIMPPEPLPLSHLVSPSSSTWLPQQQLLRKQQPATHHLTTMLSLLHFPAPPASASTHVTVTQSRHRRAATTAASLNNQRTTSSAQPNRLASSQPSSLACSARAPGLTASPSAKRSWFAQYRPLTGGLRSSHDILLCKVCMHDIA